MAFSLSASKRSTRTGVVLDARIRPKPSENSTRRPSMVMTSSAPSNWAVAASLAMSSWPFSPSGRSMFSSGVEMLCGRLLRIAEGLLLRERISSIRQPAYMPSSKPNQRSLKKMCPLVLGEQHQLAVGIDDVAVFGDHAQTVAVAVEGQADFCIAVLQGAD